MKFHSHFKAMLASVLLASTSPVLATNVNWASNALPQIANVENGKIEYFEFGHGSPIILINGYSSNLSTWDTRFLNALADYHTVIVFDNRNVGATQINSTSYTSQDLADDVYHLVEYLHLQKPAIMGISMGGMIAQEYAVRHPNAISSLILVNTAIAGDKSVVPKDGIESALFKPPQNKFMLFNKALQLFFPSSVRMPMAMALMRYHFNPRHHEEASITPAVLKQQQQLIFGWKKDNATEKKLEHLKLPVLVLNGSADEVIPPANSQILTQVIPQAKLLRWPEGGHVMIYQYPREIAEAMNGFLSRG